jgi:hypothetical protein
MKFFFKQKKTKLTHLPPPDHPLLGILVHYIIFVFTQTRMQNAKKCDASLCTPEIKITQHINYCTFTVILK